MYSAVKLVHLEYYKGNIEIIILSFDCVCTQAVNAVVLFLSFPI